MRTLEEIYLELQPRTRDFRIQQRLGVVPSRYLKVSRDLYEDYFTVIHDMPPQWIYPDDREPFLAKPFHVYDVRLAEEGIENLLFQGVPIVAED